MRKVTIRLMVGLLVVGLLAVATPAMAQFADPLTLAASGVLIPFFGNGANGDVSFLEVASPVGPNSGFHLIFFNATCTRTVSVSAPQTINDLDLFNTATAVPNTNGLIAAANVAANGIDLAPLTNPIHTRVYWVNVTNGRTRVLEPITVDTFAVGGAAIWNPLRTGVTFFAPLESTSAAGIHTLLYLICPRNTIQTATGGVFPGTIFPTILPPFQAAYPLNATPGPIRGRVYDTNERFLRDIVTDCDCLQEKTLTSINTIYSTAADAALGTYTELESNPGAGDFAFTGYKSINVTPGSVDLFGRLSNGSRVNLGGTGASVGNR